MLEQGRSPETIKEMREMRCQTPFFTPAPTDVEPKIPTWFSGEMIFDIEQFRVIEDKHNRRNAFLWIAPVIKLEENCSEAIFANFNAIERLTFSNKCIKAIKIDYSMNCLINELGVSIKASHELKIPTGPERILLFPLVWGSAEQPPKVFVSLKFPIKNIFLVLNSYLVSNYMPNLRL